jgi:hypothetical protein
MDDDTITQTDGEVSTNPIAPTDVSRDMRLVKLIHKHAVELSPLGMKWLKAWVDEQVEGTGA